MSNEMTTGKTITVFNTNGQNRNVLQGVTASTWSQLQQLLHRNQIPYEGMRAVVGETQVSLESEGARLPDNNFTLFLLPSKVKSGNWGSGSNFIQIEEEPDTVEVAEEEEEEESDGMVINPKAVALLVQAMSQILQAVQILTQHTEENHIISYSPKRDEQLDMLAQQAAELMRTLR